MSRLLLWMVVGFLGTGTPSLLSCSTSVDSPSEDTGAVKPIACPDGFQTVQGIGRLWCKNSVTDEMYVPPGTFWRGCSVDKTFSGTYCDLPRRVTMKGFAVDRNEVSSEEYAAFLNTANPLNQCGSGQCVYPNWCHGPEPPFEDLTLCASEEPVEGGPIRDSNGCILCSERGHFDLEPVNGVWRAAEEVAQRPVVQVTWEGAKAYCEWAGKPAGAQQLCTDAQWERAARGGCETVEGDCKSQMRHYPWGNETISCELAAYVECEYTQPRPVDSFEQAAGPYGTINQVGNAWEWVADWYDVAYRDSLPGEITDPIGPDSGIYRVGRGGSHVSSLDTLPAYSRIKDLPSCPCNFGLRCCRILNP